MTEVLVLGLVGSVVGVILTQVFLLGTAAWIHASKHIVLEPVAIFGTPEVCVIIGALAISILAGLVPAVKAYRMNIVKTLGQA